MDETKIIQSHLQTEVGVEVEAELGKMIPNAGLEIFFLIFLTI